MESSLNCLSHEEITKYLNEVNNLLRNNSVIIESYVLDFFTEELWNKLPQDWCESLDTFQMDNLAKLIDTNSNLNNLKVPPSLLETRRLISQFSFNRSINTMEHNAVKSLPLYEEFYNDCTSKLVTNFFRQVKLKKRHEIKILAEITYVAKLRTQVNFVIDIGAGKGHLSRVLSLVYGLNVIGVDQNKKFTEEAAKLDRECSDVIAKYYKNLKDTNRPVHINYKIRPNMIVNEFLEMIRSEYQFQENNFKFGIVGLHPCGDLAPFLLKLYKNCDNCRFINLASCCYMKMSTRHEPNVEYTDFIGFPISRELQDSKILLRYTTRELACHAIEAYVKRLLTDDCDDLKVHSYRATLEKLIVDEYPDKRRIQIKNVKFKTDMTFKQYCLKALAGNDVILEDSKFLQETTLHMLHQWKRVVIFYCLRLMFAPLVETIILLDRMLFLDISDGEFCEIRPYFDPFISPRTHLLTARK